MGARPRSAGGAVAALEALDAAGGVDELLLAGEERVAGAADLQPQLVFRRVLNAGTAARVQVEGVAHPKYDETNWWRSKDGKLAVFGSYLGLGYVALCASTAVMVVAHGWHASAGRWVTNEMGLISSVETLPVETDGFSSSAASALGSLGRTTDELVAAIARLRDLPRPASTA